MLENTLGKLFLVATTAVENTTPNIVDVITATMMENFAALGLLAPNSLLTRTLPKKIQD